MTSRMKVVRPIFFIAAIILLFGAKLCAQAQITANPDAITAVSSKGQASPQKITASQAIKYRSPAIGISPDSLHFSLPAGDSATGTITISNTGDTALSWSVGNLDTAVVRAKIRSVVEELRRSAIAPVEADQKDVGMKGRSTVPWTKASAINVVFAEHADILQRNIALLAAAGPVYAADVRNKLDSTGKFASVTIIDAGSVTPTADQLRVFDAVFVWSSAAFADTQMIGDNLADYVDAGGGVVTALFAATTQNAAGRIGGRFDRQNYWVIRPGPTEYGNATLGTVNIPDHPVMKGITTFDGGTYSYRYLSYPVEGAVSIANWAGGLPLIAERKIYGVNRIDLGMYPPSSTAYSYYWRANTDGALIMANALCYVGAKFVKLDPPGGEISAGGSQTVNVKVSAGELFGGIYLNKLGIASNDPVRSLVQLPIRLDVTGTPHIALSLDTLSFREGYVGYPDTLSFTIINSGKAALSADSFKCNNSEFTVIDSSQVSLPVNNNKSIRVKYSRLSAGSTAGTIFISSSDPDKPVITLELRGNSILPPVLSLSQSSIPQVTLNIGDSATRSLTLSNNGGSDLVFRTKFVSEAIDSPGVKVKLPDTLFDGSGFMWDLDIDGSVRKGTNGVYNGGFRLDNFYNSDSAKTERNGREIVIGPGRANQLDLYRKIYVPPNGSFIRYLEILENNSSVEKSMNVEIQSGFGHYTTHFFAASSSGDAELTRDDSWVVFRDSTNIDVPAYIHVFAGQDVRFQPNYVYGGPSSGILYYTWYQVHVPAGEKIIMMHFGAMRWTESEAVAAAEQLVNLEGEAMRGVSVQEMSLIKNFDAQTKFTVSSDSGLVQAGSSTELSIGYHAGNYLSGIFDASLRFLSNDPALPVKDLPISLKIKGYPKISVSTDTLNFGEGLVGYPDTMVLRIANDGTDPLSVTGITSGDPEFPVLGSPAFVLDVNMAREVRIQCKRSVVASLNASLTVSSDDTSRPAIAVYLTASTFNAPVMSVTPDSLGFSLLRGDTSSGGILIRNTGQSNLYWRIKDFPHNTRALRSDSLDVALLAADGIDQMRDVRSRLLLTGMFRSVSMILANSITPTLSQLKDFDAVLVWNKASNFADPYTLGNTLADYIDAGGGVVIASDAGIYSRIGGRFNDEDYWVISPTGAVQISAYLSLGTVYRPGHPLMEGVRSLYSECGALYVNPQLSNGSSLIAEWINGSPLVAERKIKGVNRVDLNLYPPSSAVNHCYWDIQTDGARLIANALSYAGRKVLRFEPSFGTLAVGSSDTIAVTADATGLAAGRYDHRFAVESNDPATPVKYIAAGLSVAGNPQISALPSSFQFSLPQGDSVKKPLVIKNTGTSDLRWAVQGVVGDTGNSKILAVAKELREIASQNMSSGAVPKGDRSVLLGYTAETAVSIAFSPHPRPGAINALLLAYENADNARDVRTKLLNTGFFNSITFVMEYYADPTVAQLKNYDAVMVWSMFGSYRDPVTLGNNLADYVDSGGGVVVPYPGGFYYDKIAGRFNSENYWAITSNMHTGYNATLGRIHQLRHPVMQGVHSFDGGFSANRYVGGVAEGASRIADWSDGNPLIAEKNVKGVSRIDLGFYPPSAAVELYGWVENTDGARIMANALVYVAKKYVSLVPSGGLLSAGDSQTVSVNINTADLMGRAYNDTIRITTNDTLVPLLKLPVGLTVSGSPEIAVYSNALNFGLVYQGSSDTLSMEILNTGSAALTIANITSSNPQYSVITQTPFSIDARNSRAISVVFSPSGSGTQSGILSIASNAVNNPTLNITLLGNGILPPELASPADKSTNIPRMQLLTWHPAFFASNYHLQVAKDSLFITLVINDSTITDTVKVMPDLEVGTRYFWRVKAKSAMAVSEWSSPWEFTTSFQPDLMVEKIDVPISAYSDQDIELRWVVQNIGAVGTNIPDWYDRVLLFPDSALDQPAAIQAGWLKNPSYLAAGESYSNTVTFRLPVGITGDYYVFVIADAGRNMTEFNEGNNLRRSATPIHVILTPPPDLRVVSINAPSNAFSGDSIGISWSVKNTGTGSTVAGEWWDGVYVSRDSVFKDSTARYIGLFNHKGILLADSGYTRLETVKLPDAIYGKYYLFVKTDCYNQVYENVWEGNNASRTDSIIIMLTPPPDLAVISLQCPAGGSSGQQLSANWTVQNQGPGAPFEKGWSDRVYLSRLPVFNPDSAIGIGFYLKTGTLLPDSSYTVRGSYMIPNGMSGTYYLYVKTDWNNKVFEYTYEDNNLRRSSDPVEIALSPWPDLQVNSIVLPAEITAGQKLTVKWNVLNAGLGSTVQSKWIDNVYLSDTSVLLSNRAKLLTSVAHSRALEASASDAESCVVSLQPDMKGLYYVHVYTDAERSVYEHSDENNNLGLSDSLRILPYPPVDLAVQDIASDTTGYSGQPVNIGWTVENIGAARTLISEWRDAIYLSQDSIFNAGEDVLVTSLVHRGELPPAGSYSGRSRIALPNGVSGNFYLFYRIDTLNQAGDVNLNNNVRMSGKRISISLTPSPDFTIEALSAIAQVNAGQPLTIRWTVSNQGAGPNLVSSWSDGIYLSYDTLFGMYRKSLGTRMRGGVLSPSVSYEESLTVEIPSYLSGDFYIFAFTDNSNNIYEHLAESNNLRMIPLKVTMPPPSDLIVTDISLPDTASCGEEVAISWTIRNQGIYQASGWMNDAVYISDDTVWQVDDPLFGVNYRYIDLAPGKSVNVSARANLAKMIRADSVGNLAGEMPGLALGGYHVIVRTDIRNNIRESNDLNNMMVSAKTMNIDVPAIQLGVQETFSLFSKQTRYYRVQVAAGLDLNIALGSNISGLSNEVYVAYDRAPTLSDFDYSTALPFTSSQRVLIPTTKQGNYYLMLLTRDFPASVDSQVVTLLASALPLSVLGISPNHGGSGGYVSCAVDGAGFREGVGVYLRSQAGSLYEGKVLKFIASTRLELKWDLVNVPLGAYDIVVKNPDTAAAALAGGYTVEALKREALYATTNIPEILPGRFSRLHVIQLTHKWNTDLPYLVVQLAIPKRQSVEVFSDRLRGFKSMAPDSLKRSGTNFYRSGDWQLIPMIARDVKVGELIQLNIVLRNIQFEGYTLPVRMSVHAMDKSLFYESVSSQIDLVRQMVLQDPSKYDSLSVSLAQDQYLFSSYFMQYYVENGLFDREDLKVADFSSMARVSSEGHLPPMPPGGGAGKVVCEALCNDVVGCIVSMGDCLIDLGLGPFGGIVELPLCAVGVTASCVLPAFGISPGAAGCIGLAAGSYCSGCASFCPYVVQVCDPNDITGPPGYGDKKWISHTQVLPYTIRFENDPAKATAPVKTVSVTLPLDSTLDPRTFRLGSFGFGSFVFNVPENRAFYSKRLDVRDSLGVYVDFSAGIDLVKNEAFWIFKSVDTATGQAPTDPMRGFLPVDDSLLHGQGFMNYTVRPKPGTTTFQKIDAVASIVFDLNEPLSTPKISNTIDADKPSSRVKGLAPRTGPETFEVSWSGNDSIGSGIKDYTVYVSVNDSPFTPWLSGVADTSAMFVGVSGSQYAFYSISRDNAGNVEESKTGPDTYTLITGVGPEVRPIPKDYAVDQNYPNPFNPLTTIRYQLPVKSNVELRIFNVIGQEVQVLRHGAQDAGYYSVRWNASNIASGIYFYRIDATSLADPGRIFTQVRKMVICK